MSCMACAPPLLTLTPRRILLRARPHSTLSTRPWAQRAAPDPNTMSYLKRFCEECGEHKRRDEYRVNQWRNCGPKARCLECQDSERKTKRGRNGVFKKGEVVHCGQCDQYMKAPEHEEVSGLRCAVADCRHLIWAPGSDDPAPQGVYKSVRCAQRWSPSCICARPASQHRPRATISISAGFSVGALRPESY